ncbi:16434_t:CDS:2 [Funneliformis caledonium]|uniref:16434_t:CDS:1 n=1 Tax=Funneliformis caledonium TaxID=1117310 RepID=A0A9N9CY10_9GLOM|nr:16434_t:CDS:2 [Funneliformis caledonium]
MKQLFLNYATLSNALSTQLEGKPERRKLKDDRNLTKVWDKKDVLFLLLRKRILLKRI